MIGTQTTYFELPYHHYERKIPFLEYPARQNYVELHIRKGCCERRRVNGDDRR